MINLGQNIDVVTGIFDDTLLDVRGCAGLEIAREPLCCAVSIAKGNPGGVGSQYSVRRAVRNRTFRYGKAISGCGQDSNLVITFGAN